MIKMCYVQVHYEVALLNCHVGGVGGKNTVNTKLPLMWNTCKWSRNMWNMCELPSDMCYHEIHSYSACHPQQNKIFLLPVHYDGISVDQCRPGLNNVVNVWHHPWWVQM